MVNSSRTASPSRTPRSEAASCAPSPSPPGRADRPHVTTIGMRAFLGIGFMAGWVALLLRRRIQGDFLATFSACLRLSLRAFARFAAATAFAAPRPGTARGCLLREPTSRAVRVGLKWNTAITRPSQPGSSKCGEARGQERTRGPTTAKRGPGLPKTPPIQVNESAAVLRPFSRSRGLPPEHGIRGAKSPMICRPRDLSVLGRDLGRQWCE